MVPNATRVWAKVIICKNKRDIGSNETYNENGSKVLRVMLHIRYMWHHALNLPPKMLQMFKFLYGYDEIGTMYRKHLLCV